MFYGFFDPFHLLAKIIGKITMDLWVQVTILTTTSHVFTLKLLILTMLIIVQVQ